MRQSSRGQKEFSKMLKEKAKEGVTHQDIADAIGAHRTSVTMYGSGLRRPKLVPAVKIEQLFGIPPRDWLR